jgi:RES domain-containing protein
MAEERRARDHRLLDALGELQAEPFTGKVWRVVREGRDPLQPSMVQGRWSSGNFDVLYTSLVREGACTETHFHLSRQPIFPSELRFWLHELGVNTRQTLRLPTVESLIRLGVEEPRYQEILYEQTQAIADAARFMGFDGLVVPSARWDGLNLVLFTDALQPDDIELVRSEEVAWVEWREKFR